MKILQVISGLGIGGAEKLVLDLTQELSESNDVIICVLKNIDIEELTRIKEFSKIRIYTLKKSKGFDLRVYFKIFKLFRRLNPDVVHFHLDATIKYIIPFSLFFKFNYVYTIHSDLNNEKLRIFKKLNSSRIFWKKIKYVCISKNIQHEFQSRYPKMKFYLVENGIKELSLSEELPKVCNEIQGFSNNFNKKVLISVGRLDENKNQKMLIDVFNKPNFNNAILVIIGEDPSPDKSYLNNLKNECNKNVFILGPKSNIADYLYYSDAVCLASFNEGLPIFALEALSLGKPIISTPAGGMVDIVHNEINGYLSLDFSSENYAVALNSFFAANFIENENIKKANREKYLENYTIQRCSEKYLNLYV